ncbi:MAG: metal-binding protein [Eubacteriaceae bacterium]|nr:metal-binding protein [Eubacteriaceae bacterium]
MKCHLKGENFRFFSHTDCEFFPCHQFEDTENFNCLCCYCPLYALGKECGGNFKITASGVKDCTGCTFPHKRENYDLVLKKLKLLYQKVTEEINNSSEKGYDSHEGE